MIAGDTISALAISQIATLRTLLSQDPLRRRALEAVAALALPDCWIGAGFVRDAVWDDLHRYGTRPPGGDVDVIWFDPAEPESMDQRIERELGLALPEVEWSVKNQARMHRRNGDAPYISVAAAMRYWPETATAIAARMDAAGSIDINAPFGLDDLFALRLKPTPAFATSKLSVFDRRVSDKCWVARYPRLIVSRVI